MNAIYALMRSHTSAAAAIVTISDFRSGHAGMGRRKRGGAWNIFGPGKTASVDNAVADAHFGELV